MSQIKLRPATSEDANRLAALLNQIIKTGGTTAHLHPFDRERLLNHYLAPPSAISCFVAEVGGTIAGFQALEWSDPNWPGPDSLPADWALIASFVDADFQGRGIGKALFTKTLAAAQSAGARCIDATIRADNQGGLAFYTSLGFTDYSRLRDIPLSDGTLVDRIRKKLNVSE
ncbi:MAG: GNAT family N-acetyltransferase [Paracoccaceae bacterium]